MYTIMVLLFITNGVLTMETKPFNSPEACLEHAQKRVEELIKDPHFDEGLLAACVPSKLQEIKRIGQKVYGL